MPEHSRRRSSADERSPAHKMAQSLLDQRVRIMSGLWSADLEAQYAAALEASGLPEQLRGAMEALQFYADHRNHRGVGTSNVYRDMGRMARAALGLCPTCTRYGDGLGYVPTGKMVGDQDGVSPEHERCPDCNGAGYTGARL